MDDLAQYDKIPDEQKSAFILGEIQKNPDAVFATLRAQRPILVTPGPNRIAIVTRYRDVEEGLARWNVFSVRGYGQRIKPTTGPFMLGCDDTPLNEREKSIMLAMLPREELPQLRASCDGWAAAALAPALANGRCDVVETLSRPVPIELVARYFGFPGPDAKTMARWSYATQRDIFHNLANDPVVHANGVAAGEEMRVYLKQLFAERRASSDLEESTDVVSRLLKSHIPEEIGWHEERIISNVMGLLVGAVETANTAIVQALDQFLSRPEIAAAAGKAALFNDDATFDALVWEVLRFNPIAPFVARFAMSNYVLAAGSDHAAEIPAGTLTLMSIRSAMQDPLAFPEPDAVRTDRPGFLYMHFGDGPHTCLGKYAGMTMVCAILKQILLLPKLRRAEGAAGQIDFRGGPFPESLSVCFG